MNTLISVVCMTPSGKFLVAKGNNRSVLPGLWTCGIFESSDDKLIEESIRDFYLEEFNADVSVITQPDGEVKRALPLTIFSLNFGTIEKPIIANGIYFAAVLRNPYQLKALGRYYDEILLYDLVELATTIANVDIIPDLYYNLIQVQENYKETFTRETQAFINPTDSLDIDEIEEEKKEEETKEKEEVSSNNEEESETKEVENSIVDDETLVIQKSEQDE